MYHRLEESCYYQLQRPNMPKTNKSSAQGNRPDSPPEEDVPSTQEELSSSEHETDPEVSFHPHCPPQPSTSQERQPQPAAGMYMPCIEGPHMDWTVNDGLYHRFLKWHLKCKNILECKLVALPECKKVLKGNCLEHRLWDGPVCVMEPILR